MTVQIKLSLPQEEYSALLQACIRDLRNPSEQTRYILRQELQRRGLLPERDDVSALPQPSPLAEGNSRAG